MKPRQVYKKAKNLVNHFPNMTKPQQRNLAYFISGLCKARSPLQADIAGALCIAGIQNPDSIARRLRRFIANPELRVAATMMAWQRLILRRLPGKALDLLVDETKLPSGMAMMMVGVAFEGRAIPLAFRVYKPSEYPAEGQVKLILALLKQIQQALPASKEATVYADRGIGTSPDLCRGIDALGFYYELRVTKQTKIVAENGEEFTIYDQVKPGETWSCRGRFFKKRGRIKGWAYAIWEKGYKEPLVLVSNKPNLTRHSYRYAHRSWIEQTFRDIKSGGFNLMRSRLRDPQHMASMMVLISLSYGLLVSLGCYAVQEEQARALTENLKQGQTRCSWGEFRRHLSLFKEGLKYTARHGMLRCLGRPLLFMADARLAN